QQWVPSWDEGEWEDRGRDEEMENKTDDELSAFMRTHYDRLHDLQTRKAGDRAAIGLEAWQLKRAWSAWSDRGHGARAETGVDPIGGLTPKDMPFDIDELGQLADPKLRVRHLRDAFMNVELEQSPQPVSLEDPPEGQALKEPTRTDRELDTARAAATRMSDA